MAVATTTSKTVRLAGRPQEGLPGPGHFELVEEPIAELDEGEALVRVDYIGIEPAMRAWIDDRPSYISPVSVGDTMRALGVGRVVDSRADNVDEGDYVSGVLGAQEFSRQPGAALVKVDRELAPLPVHLSALGMTGMTGYFGLLEVGRPEPGQTVVVSSAAGAVGSIAGQVAKGKGCRVVGIAGGPEKRDYVVDELGFDAAIDYKGEDVEASLGKHCPDKIDVYFDNVGGEILDAALAHLAFGARVVLCGAVSQYNAGDQMHAPANYLSLLVNRASMAGFIIIDYFGRYPEFAQEMGGWLKSGDIKSREHIVDGLGSFPEALRTLFAGENRGKLEIRVSEEG